MLQPIVSVIMPAFNSQAYIAKSIESIKNQSFTNWELIIIDGGSTDRTYSIVQYYAYQDSRITLLLNPNDQGPAHARAYGIMVSKGDYIAFLDADDLWIANKLELQLAFMQVNCHEFTFTRYRKFWNDGKVGGLIPMDNSYTFAQYLGKRGIGNLTVMISRKLFTENILFKWRKSGGEDTLWWLLILRNKTVARLLDVDLARYRSTPGSLSKNQIHTLQTVWSMYRLELGLTPIYTLFVFIRYLINVFIRRSLTHINKWR